jgi:hypothetical protein
MISALEIAIHLPRSIDDNGELEKRGIFHPGMCMHTANELSLAGQLKLSGAYVQSRSRDI